MLKDHGKRNIKAANERAVVEDISDIKREKEKERNGKQVLGLFYSQDLLASHKERRNSGSTPQYENIIGLKPEGIQQCAELSCIPGTCNAISRCIATSGRQDFRWVLVSAGFAWPKSSGESTEKGTRRSRFAKGTRVGDRPQRFQPALRPKSMMDSSGKER